MTTKTELITRGERVALLVRPEGAATTGVLLLPSVFGIDNSSTAYAQALAEAGLTAVIWEPFHGQPPADAREQRAARLATLTDAISLGEMTWWLDFMLGELSLNTVGTAGFCLGGRYGLLLAAREARIAACVSYYPTIETPPLPGQDEDVLSLSAEIGCPVHMIRAGKDHLTTEDVFQRLQRNLQTRAAPTTVQVYPEGDHGFMQRSGGANDAANKLSQPQTIAFLKAALGLTVAVPAKAGTR
jgi:carboxymethylenebutenolidase